MSMHVDRAVKVARDRGAWAGQECARDLWDLSKRELVEIGLRLADQTMGGAGLETAVGRCREELRVLRDQGIV